jgi:thioredoxin-related protein
MILLVKCGKIYSMDKESGLRSPFPKWAAMGMFLIALSFVHTTLLADAYTDTLKKAKAEDKPMVLYFYSNYCGYCDLMEKEVLADKEISNTIKKSLVFLGINVDKQSDLAGKYNIRGYPTTWLLEPSGKRIIQIPGYVDKKDYRLVLAYAKGKHYKTMRFSEFMKKSGVN